MSETLVWAYKPLPDLNNETGFVACDAKLAAKLIDSGDVQDPAIGAHHFKEIETAAIETYETKVMAARKRGSKAGE